MIAEYELKIRLRHDVAKQGNAAVAVSVDDVAEYVQRVRIGEARLVKQGFKLIHGIAVEVGDGVGQELVSPQPSLAAWKACSTEG